MSDIAVTVTSPGSVNATIGVGGAVSATVSSGGSVAVNLPGGEAAWANITGKPTEFTPSAHTHQAADITDRSTALVTSVNGQTGDITITEVGGGASLSDVPPQVLGEVSAGTGLLASRDDHVHPMPTAADVGALDTNSVIDGGDYVGQILYPNQIIISSQPSPQSASNGAATFTVVASVTPSGTLAYQWQRSDDGGVSWSNISYSSSSLILSGLSHASDDGDQYRVVISADNAADVTSASAVLTVSPASLPGAPPSLTVYARTNELELNWNSPTTDGGAPITAYLVQASDDGGTTWLSALSQSTITAAYLGVLDLNQYSVRVAAINEAGTGPFSDASEQIGRSAPTMQVAWSPNSSNGVSYSTDSLASNGYRITLVSSGDYSNSEIVLTFSRDCRVYCESPYINPFGLSVMNGANLQDALTANGQLPTSPNGDIPRYISGVFFGNNDPGVYRLTNFFGDQIILDLYPQDPELNGDIPYLQI